VTTLNVDTTLIETLAELLQRTGLTEIELCEGESRIRVARTPAPIVSTVMGPAVAGPTMALGTAEATGRPATAESEASHPGTLRAPMVGTVYLTPEPGAQPFVSVGSTVQEGQTLLIIEAMKVMNPLRAPHGGRVTRILVSNGDPVEYGEALLIIE
jgi:acetyl-CoA carboxylase biotin carboxyl carrier protein